MDESTRPRDVLRKMKLPPGSRRVVDSWSIYCGDCTWAVEGFEWDEYDRARHDAARHEDYYVHAVGSAEVNYVWEAPDGTTYDHPYRPVWTHDRHLMKQWLHTMIDRG